MRTDAELLRSYEPEAFGEFYERHVDTVAAYLARRTRHADVLFDLLAETFARAYEHRTQHDPRKGPAIAWLLSTARYVVADAERAPPEERRNETDPTPHRRLDGEVPEKGRAHTAPEQEREHHAPHQKARLAPDEEPDEVLLLGELETVGPHEAER